MAERGRSRRLRASSRRRRVVDGSRRRGRALRRLRRHHREGLSRRSRRARRARQPRLQAGHGRVGRRRRFAADDPQPARRARLSRPSLRDRASSTASRPPPSAACWPASIVAAGGTALLMALPHLGHDGHRAMAAVALPTVAIAGWPFFVSAYKALRARSVNMDVPIAAGVLLSVLASLFATAAAHAGLLRFRPDAARCSCWPAAILDQRMRRKTREFAASLASLRPERASRLDANGEATRRRHRRHPPRRSRARARRRAHPGGRRRRGRPLRDRPEPRHRRIAPRRPSRRAPRSTPAPSTSAAPCACGSPRPPSARLLDEVNGLIEKAVEQRSSYVKLADRAARWYAPLVGAASLGAFFGWLSAGGSLAGLAASRHRRAHHHLPLRARPRRARRCRWSRPGRCSGAASSSTAATRWNGSPTSTPSCSTRPAR